MLNNENNKYSRLVKSAVWRSGSALVLINKVNLCQARLVLGWVTVPGFDSRGCYFISVCNRPPRSTQPATLRRWWNEYQPKGGDALRLGSKGRYGFFAGKTVVLPYLSALENALLFKGALQMSMFTLLLQLYFSVEQEMPYNNKIRHAKVILNLKRRNVTDQDILCHNFLKIQTLLQHNNYNTSTAAFSFV